MMNRMCECVTVLGRIFEIIVQVVDVHVAVAEAPAWRNVEIPNDLVDPESPLDPTTFFALRIQTLGVAFPLTLFDILASTKGPRYRSVCFAHLLACVAAARPLSVRWCWSAVTAAAIFRVEMSRFVLLRVPRECFSISDTICCTKDLQVQGFRFDDMAAFTDWRQSELVHAMHDARLLLSRYIHDIESEKLARYPRK